MTSSIVNCKGIACKIQKNMMMVNEYFKLNMF